MTMPSRSFLRMSAATAAALLVCTVDVADALPSFGSKIPNGQKVPCPPSLLEDNSSGCSASGYCFGLGHPNCGGFQPGDRVDGNLVLSSFGEDLKSNGYVWTKDLCEADSDGDGFTNGEELGDPCCVWSQDSFEVMLDSVEGFLPSHPGMKDHTPPLGFTFDKASMCDDVEDEMETEDEPASIDQYYNPGESRGSMEFRIKPYPIPVKTTTYVNFFFNIPEDAPDLFHVVFGEALVSQPDHLHHFVLQGCSVGIDPSEEGIPNDRSEADCGESLGGWAPGSDLFANDSLDSGVIIGRGLGIEGFMLNVHYTDGVYEDPEALTYRMATDGIRIHYTTDFRPFTSTRKRLLWIASGPQLLNVPPNESRYFVSKTCHVNTQCTDISGEQLQQVARFMGVTNANAGGVSLGDDLSCSSIKPLCFLGGRFGPVIQHLCPASCGLCDGDENPRNPESYRVTSINYHAHLLGREMYATLLREVDDETSSPDEEQEQSGAIIQKKASEIDVGQTKLIVKDMESREFWDYNDQASIPFGYDIAASDPNSGASTPLKKGMEIKPGDKIEVTCVYDSTGRNETTKFGLSTYDEMCIISVALTFETPKALLGGNEADASAALIDTFTDIKLRSFSCDSDYVNGTTNAQQGTLADEEDARNIWFDHPIEETDFCSFPVYNFRIMDNVMTSRSPPKCPVDESEEEVVEVDENSSDNDQKSWIFDQKICDGISTVGDVEFLEEAIAGYTCVGGTFDKKDSHEEPLYVTEKDCLEVGGGTEYNAYTCAEIEYWIQFEAHTLAAMTDQTLEYRRIDWWQPKCCLHNDVSESESSATRIRDSAALVFFAAAMFLAMI